MVCRRIGENATTDGRASVPLPIVDELRKIDDLLTDVGGDVQQKPSLSVSTDGHG